MYSFNCLPANVAALQFAPAFAERWVYQFVVKPMELCAVFEQMDKVVFVHDVAFRLVWVKQGWIGQETKQRPALPLSRSEKTGQRDPKSNNGLQERTALLRVEFLKRCDQGVHGVFLTA